MVYNMYVFAVQLSWEIYQSSEWQVLQRTSKIVPYSYSWYSSVLLPLLASRCWNANMHFSSYLLGATGVTKVGVEMQIWILAPSQSNIFKINLKILLVRCRCTKLQHIHLHPSHTNFKRSFTIFLFYILI